MLTGVLDALPAGIALFSARSEEFTFCCGNREFARVVGLDRVPRDGQPAGEVFELAERDAIVELLGRVRTRRDPQSYFASEDGEPGALNRIWNIDAYPVFNAGRLSHIMVLAEHAEEKFEARQRQQLEADRLRQKADRLADLEEAKSEFLRLASHELRGPAAMLGGYLSMIEDETLGPIPAGLRPVLPLLKAKAAQINMLANEMVEAARLEDRRLQLKQKHVDLREVVQRSIQAARASLTTNHRLDFDEHVLGEVPVFADVMRLDIIIDNLIDNAIKFSPAGGDITVQLSLADGLAVVSVRDVGIGIAAEDIERLFVRFNRLGQTDVPGTGLGLYLARELARLHGGDINVNSRPGEGSEFTLSLPLETTRR